MAVKVGINGFGRIGRNIYRASRGKTELDVVAVNDITSPEMLAHLLKYDSILGNYEGSVKAENGTLVVDGAPLRVLAERDPAKLPWRDLGVDVVVESTGFFTEGPKARVHIDRGGARKVVISAPARGEDITIVLGVNEKAYDPGKHAVISNASCTTNCLAPVAKVLQECFGIESGIMTTVHAYTSDQRLVDAPHEDFRRARAAALSVIPTTTGAARAVALVLPELKGKFHGMALRVPVPNVSLVDLSAHLKTKVSADTVNEAFREAAASELQGILSVCEAPLVSADFKGDAHSSIVDAPSTIVVGDRHAKVLAWYDNEWGYSCRVVDLVAYIGKTL